MADDEQSEPDADSDEPQALEDISGVGASKADALRDAGFESIEDIKQADQDDLAEADGVGNALAARIKACLLYTSLSG
ncbi:50S ribosomal protein L32e, partial [Halobiforma nitratireducens JCM 10879]